MKHARKHMSRFKTGLLVLSSLLLVETIGGCDFGRFVGGTANIPAPAQIEQCKKSEIRVKLRLGDKKHLTNGTTVKLTKLEKHEYNNKPVYDFALVFESTRITSRVELKNLIEKMDLIIPKQNEDLLVWVVPSGDEIEVLLEGCPVGSLNR
ncbi:hypothetical protein HYT84_01185 [Candidatus Micrarchaeota archaeon]|nr:hypothetical protein [Candidatus Micrarchaeota archaeon]